MVLESDMAVLRWADEERIRMCARLQLATSEADIRKGQVPGSAVRSESANSAAVGYRLAGFFSKARARTRDNSIGTSDRTLVASGTGSSMIRRICSGSSGEEVTGGRFVTAS